MDTSIVKAGQLLPAKSMSDLATAGELLAQSGMFGIQNAAAGFVVAATCFQQGISLMEFTRTYHIVEGRPSMRADAMLAEFRKLGGKHRILSNTVDKAAVEMEFEGQQIKFEYTMDDARRTGDCFKGDGKTLKHTWVKRPDDMLWARVVSRAIRKICPEICAGVYTPEEVSDFEPGPSKREQAITPEDAVNRMKTAAGVVIDVPDPEVCPDGCGNFSGMRWDEIPTETLQAALASLLPAITDSHRAAITAVIAERATGGK